MRWRRMLAVAVPLALLVFGLGFIVGLEVHRGPNWRLELDEFIAEQGLPPGSITVERAVKAGKPWHFTAVLGTPPEGDWIRSSSPVQEVRCVLLRLGAGGGDVRQVIFLVHHSDALYRVGWLAYEGPKEPFGPEVMAHLNFIGCDLGLR